MEDVLEYLYKVLYPLFSLPIIIDVSSEHASSQCRSFTHHFAASRPHITTTVPFPADVVIPLLHHYRKRVTA